MTCKFYGKAALDRNRELVSTHGNQCALKFGVFAPCHLETAGNPPELEHCEMNGSARAIEAAAFTLLGEEVAH
jgi:hypothetical protein